MSYIKICASRKYEPVIYLPAPTKHQHPGWAGSRREREKTAVEKKRKGQNLQDNGISTSHHHKTPIPTLQK
jgi:hypothetical protein